MCGIVGIIDKTGKNVDDDDIRKMCSTIVHRGPDDEGRYTYGSVGIGMRRLNIIDLSTGHQPIHNEDKSLWIVFNGEIYNYQELRNDLVKKGHAFYTTSDTEAIIHAYEEYGSECLEKLRGMFAFAILDRNHDSVFIARDRMGIKPLFYCETGDRIYFASEMKAILAFNNIKRGMNWHAFDAFFTLSYIPSPMTIFQNIHKLNPGHYMTIYNGRISIQQYWDLTFKANKQKKESEFEEEFLSVFEEAVRMHLVSDVPIGAFLSGGVDSSAVVAMMSRHHPSVRTLSIGFGGNIGVYDDERKYARLVSDKFGTLHREYVVNADACSSDLIENIVCSFDEPFADHGAIPNYFVCKMARENMTVALSGLGGDELFSGYPRHLGFALSEIYATVPSVMRNTVIPYIVEKLPESKGGEVHVNWLKRFVRGGRLPPEQRYMTYVNLMSGYRKTDLYSQEVLKVRNGKEFGEEFLSFFRSKNAKHSVDKVCYTDIKTYLPDDILALTDRISMMHSLEVRVPFLDHKLVEFCATIPHQLKMRFFKPKYLLKKSLHDILPENVLKHKKQGFVSPMNIWLNTRLKNYVRDTILSAGSTNVLFQKKAVESVLDEHYAGKQLNTALIWSLLTFTIWQKKYLTEGNYF